ncbi:MAG TPA: nucleotidyl transferase AbiEii/AbiGii toxin family protein [Thermoanaerobaculia bacterium]|jgi:hypothetical protein|nr:nucleotidyl transferase AbiEii/AbiGii toxin family protein [Thermoanaerobaculia bacterium]
MAVLDRALFRLDADLRALGVEWALVGGVAINLYVEPRTTRDLDLAIVVDGDSAAEDVILSLRNRGYYDNPEGALVEQTDVGRLATARLISPVEESEGCPVDLLFASSGIERQIVASAQRMRIFPSLVAAVARPGHLVALKVLAGRPQDRVDLFNLLADLEVAELNAAREALEAIQYYGYGRGKNLLRELGLALAEMR